ncbi:glycerophosphodiester phosphodiesterase family protein [Cytophagaceae bacterium YF14B1]|uniref:Glycerophosphodiester phosphodiesterase family protein n=1 Tax=Xanthocytophaga flava TaxID=3048013 RepID=A0AAE3U9C7_9BACT|nr:glycerophosphodiester phosphodiesterase family protein [Xanthocytophaga flavus]MDJ1484366.1 glycerophosphodiester phosphodiesterase family protein [Xanthocytophaga flavus]
MKYYHRTCSFITICNVLIACLVTISVFGWNGFPGKNGSVVFPSTRYPFIVIAHRGNHVNAPENSIQSLQDAIRVGADYVEVDIRTTKDGYLVIMHDGSVNRTTNGEGKIAEMTLSQFKALKLKDGPTNQTPPTFEEILKEARGKVNLYLDCKDVKPEQVKSLLNKYKMLGSVIVYTEPEEVQDWKKTMPSVPVMVSMPDSITSYDELKQWIVKNPVDILDGSVLSYTRENVAFLTKQGIKVWPDIQNPDENPTQWQKAIDMGITSLQTDHPQELIQYLKTLGKH